MKFKVLLSIFVFVIFHASLMAQESLHVPKADSAISYHDSLDAIRLRIINMNPYFTLHVDSVLQYNFEINKPAQHYYWYLKNAPVGVKLDKNNGLLYFKADKSFFKSGKLKYDQPYKVELGVQSLANPSEKVDTFCTIVFYSTEIIPSKLKPTISNNLTLEEGDTVRFRIQCDEGTFPTEHITMYTNIPIANYTTVKKCDDEFEWMVPYDFIRDNDTAKQKVLSLRFVGADKFHNRDTAEIRLTIRPGVDYPTQYMLHKKVSTELATYVATLKLTFYVISRNIKKNKSTRIGFDITSSTTALAGTALSTAGETTGAKNVGKILPSVGLTLVPVKEAVAPNKVQEQNTATQVRSVAKRLEYLVSENALVGNRDVNVQAKIKKMQDELKAARLQLVDLPLVEFDENLTLEDVEKFFSDPKVNKKYKLKVN